MIKQKAFRSKKYLKWVKSQPCMMSGQPADDAHHGIGLKLGGMGTKAPDSACMPLIRAHHSEMHLKPELWPSQWEMIAKTLMKAIDEGVFIEA